MKNKILNILGILSSLILLLLFVFYYRIGIGFGEAMVNTAEGLKNAQEDWISEGVNPLDSLKNQIIQIMDTTSSLREEELSPLRED